LQVGRAQHAASALEVIDGPGGAQQAVLRRTRERVAPWIAVLVAQRVVDATLEVVLVLGGERRPDAPSRSTGVHDQTTVVLEALVTTRVRAGLGGRDRPTGRDERAADGLEDLVGGLLQLVLVRAHRAGVVDDEEEVDDR